MMMIIFVYQDLEAKLQEVQDARMRLIVTDGVFSMDGNVAPLPQICALAEKYNAMVFIDDCHATGFFGKTGRLVMLGCSICYFVPLFLYPTLLIFSFFFHVHVSLTLHFFSVFSASL